MHNITLGKHSHSDYPLEEQPTNKKLKINANAPSKTSPLDSASADLTEFPRELLELIFSELNIGGLEATRLVSKHCGQVLTHPNLTSLIQKVKNQAFFSKSYYWT